MNILANGAYEPKLSKLFIEVANEQPSMNYTLHAYRFQKPRIQFTWIYNINYYIIISR